MFNIFKVPRTVAVYSHCIFAAAIIYIDALTGVAVPIMRPANSIAESDMDGCSTMQQSQKHLLAAFCNLSLLILFTMNLALEKKRLGRSGLNSYPFFCAFLRNTFASNSNSMPYQQIVDVRQLQSPCLWCLVLVCCFPFLSAFLSFILFLCFLHLVNICQPNIKMTSWRLSEYSVGLIGSYNTVSVSY